MAADKEVYTQPLFHYAILIFLGQKRENGYKLYWTRFKWWCNQKVKWVVCTGKERHQKMWNQIEEWCHWRQQDAIHLGLKVIKTKLAFTSAVDGEWPMARRNHFDIVIIIFSTSTRTYTPRYSLISRLCFIVFLPSGLLMDSTAAHQGENNNRNSPPVRTSKKKVM